MTIGKTKQQHFHIFSTKYRVDYSLKKKKEKKDKLSTDQGCFRDSSNFLLCSRSFSVTNAVSRKKTFSRVFPFVRHPKYNNKLSDHFAMSARF